MPDGLYTELVNLARDFYELFDTMLSIYDSEKKLIAAYPKDLCEFCTYIRTSKELKRRCLQHDRTALEVCDKTRMPYVYKCHMGLVETSAPIVKDGSVLGYLMFGQLTDDPQNTNTKQIIRNLDVEIDREHLLKTLTQVKPVSRPRVEAMSRMLIMCTTYIQTKDIFGREKEHMAYAITEFIKRNLSMHISSTDLCAYLSVSRSTLFTLSKKYFGMGISEYINQVKISAAREKLRNEEITIDCLADEVGFPDSNYFCKVFKKFAGMTPSEYRQRFKI